MSRSLAGILAALTVIVVIGAYLSFSGRESTLAPKEETTGELFPGLREKLESVDRVVLERAEGNVTLEKNNGQWIVANNAGYWADEERLRKLFTGLSSIETLEPKTSNPDWYEKLGVQDPDEPESRSVRVTLFDGESELASLVVGNVKSGYQSTQERYIRPKGDERAWLVRSPLAADGDKKAWTSRTILDVVSTRIRSVSIDRWDGDDTLIKKDSPEDASFKLETLPEGMELSTRGDLMSIARSFQNLTHSDVFRASGFFDTLTSQTLVTAKTFDGVVIEASLRSEGEDTYATFVARYDDSVAVDPPSEKDESDLLTPEDARKQVAEINERVSGWAYQLPNWKVRNMAKPNSELVQEPQPEEPESDTQTETVTPSGIQLPPGSDGQTIDIERLQRQLEEQSGNSP